MVPWLRYGTTEIANANRTLAYLVGLPRISVGTSAGCECAAVDDGPYTNPANDDAPWYEPTRPESAEFLGIMLDPMEFLPGWSRAVEQRPSGGARIGAPVLPGRTLAVEGVMFASSLPGMVWGERWLTEALRSGCGDGCCTADVCVLPSCPPVGVCADDYFRVVRDAALVDGPTFSPIVADRSAAQRVGFLLTSSSGYLFSEPVLVAHGTLA
jgi:hypothetical protein